MASDPDSAAFIKRLGPSDEETLAFLAIHDAEFDIPGRGGPKEPLNSEGAHAYLANPSVLFWIASCDEEIIGFLSCLLLPMRAGKLREVLVYEIGVHKSHRLKGVGRRLMAEMENWMPAEGISQAWVLADNPGAEAFYLACEFTIDPTKPTYLNRNL